MMSTFHIIFVLLEEASFVFWLVFFSGLWWGGILTPPEKNQAKPLFSVYKIILNIQLINLNETIHLISSRSIFSELPCECKHRETNNYYNILFPLCLYGARIKYLWTNRDRNTFIHLLSHIKWNHTSILKLRARRE